MASPAAATRTTPRIKQPRRGIAASIPCRSLARYLENASEAVSTDHETTGQLSVVSGQRFAGSNCGPRSRVRQSVLGACRRPQRRDFVQLGPRRQANSWQASLVSAERFDLVLLHQNQLPQWHDYTSSRYLTLCCLTPRSSRAPTAGHQARSGGTRYIFASPGLASHRRCRLNSNVRHQNEAWGVSSRKCGAQRRESNSHGAAKPRAVRAARLHGIAQIGAWR